jgi:hypothetical protein
MAARISVGHEVRASAPDDELRQGREHDRASDCEAEREGEPAVATPDERAEHPGDRQHHVA